jgi:hypothetical protein
LFISQNKYRSRLSYSVLASSEPLEEAAEGGGAGVDLNEVVDAVEVGATVEDVQEGASSPSSREAASTLTYGLGCDWALSNEAKLAVNLSARTTFLGNGRFVQNV